MLAAFSPVKAEDTAPTFRTDFYEAVNAQWLASAEIPADKYMVGGFDDLSEDVVATLMADFSQMIADGETPGDPRLAEFLKLYSLALDFEQRNADGLAPIKPYIEKIDAIDSVASLEQNLVDLLLDGITTPLVFAPSEDVFDPTSKTLYFSGAGLFLPDVSYYDESSEVGAMMLSMFADTVRQLLQLAGYDETRADEIVSGAMAFDALQIPLAFTAEEQADISNIINPMALPQLAESLTTLDLNKIVETAFGDVSHLPYIIVMSPRFFEAFNDVVNDDNIGIIRDWMTVHAVLAFAANSSEEAIAILQSYNNAITGQEVSEPMERVAYSAAHGVFAEVIGLYYGHKYFGEQSRDSVTKMVENMIDAYRARLDENTWLSEQTRGKAKLKLDTMLLQIGYPDKIDPLYDELKVVSAADGGTYAGNITELNRVILKDAFDRFTKPTDRTLWLASADTVNAFYNPQFNSIVFPAAILQPPFYSADRSDSENYGGIGAVIAHEISHAFDTNGAKFDETGAMADWWLPEDYERFEELAEKMVDAFDGIEYAGMTLNGRQIVNENVADAGGLGCALQVVQSLPDADIEAFFISWATIWRGLIRPEAQQLIITSDTHAPNKLRANFQPAMLDEFYDAFGIVEGDPMYRAPEDRVKVW
jgi:putative endopeptidase